MKKIYSFYNNIKITKPNQNDALKALKKKFSFNKGVKAATTLEEVLKACGWDCYKDKYSQCVTLKYNSDEWTFRSEIALRVLAPYVYKGSSIKIANEQKNRYYHYLYEDNELIRRQLVKEIIDFDCKEQLESLFILCTKNLIRLGYSSVSLKKLIQKIVTESILNK